MSRSKHRKDFGVHCSFESIVVSARTRRSLALLARVSAIWESWSPSLSVVEVALSGSAAFRDCEFDVWSSVGLAVYSAHVIGIIGVILGMTKRVLAMSLREPDYMNTYTPLEY